MTKKPSYNNSLMHELTLCQAVFDLSDTATAIVKPDYTIYKVNQAFARMHGNTVEGLQGQSFLNSVSPVTQVQLEEQFELALRQDKHTYESVHLRKDGTSFLVLTGIATLSNSGNENDYFVVNIQDMTTKLHVEQQLREALAFNQSIINAIPDLLFEVDRNGTYLNIWAQHAELLAAEEKEIIGRTVIEILPPDAAAIVMEAIEEADEKGHSFGKVICLDVPVGTRWFELSVSKNTWIRTKISHFIVLSRDITKRKNMENKIRVSEQEFRALVENSPDNITRYDKACRRIYANPTFLRQTKLPEKAVLGITPSEHFSYTETAIAYKNKLQEVLETGIEGEFIFEFSWDKQADRPAIIHIRITPEIDSDGRVNSVLAIGRDITALKHAEQQLHELNAHRETAREEERAAIAQDIHDDVGGMLAAVKMDINLLSSKFKRVDITPDIKNHVNKMTDHVDQLIQTIRRIISNLRPSIIDNLGLIDAIEWQLSEIGRDYDVECEFTSFIVQGEFEFENHEQDIVSVFRIIQELLTNIVKHSGASRITMFIADIDNNFVLSLSDNGCGMDKNQRSRPDSFGIIGIGERVRNMQGSFDIISRKDIDDFGIKKEVGTTTIINIPLRK